MLSTCKCGFQKVLSFDRFPLKKTLSPMKHQTKGKHALQTTWFFSYTKSKLSERSKGFTLLNTQRQSLIKNFITLEEFFIWFLFLLFYMYSQQPVCAITFITVGKTFEFNISSFCPLDSSPAGWFHAPLEYPVKFNSHQIVVHFFCHFVLRTWSSALP